MESKNKWYTCTYLHNRNRHIDSENKLFIAGEEIVKEFGVNTYTLLCLKWVTNKNLLYSTGNSAQRYMAAWMEEEFGREWIHIYVWLSRSAVYLKLSQDWSAILQYKIKCFPKKSLHLQPFCMWNCPTLWEFLTLHDDCWEIVVKHKLNESEPNYL